MRNEPHDERTKHAMVTRSELLRAAQTTVTTKRGWKADHNGWIFDPERPGENLGAIEIVTTGKRRRTYAVINLSGSIGDAFNTVESVAAGELYGSLTVHDFYTGKIVNDDHAGRVEALMEIAQRIEKTGKA